MLEKIKALSDNSKYTTWYCNIIVNALGRKRFKGCERHHIVPKSVWKEGTKRKDNIVMLTSKEHFICHRLLAKIMLDATNKRCMESAFWLMLNSGQNTYTSTTYAIARRNKSNAMEIMWTNQKYKDDMLMKKQWFYNDPVQKEANRQKALNEMKDLTTKNKFVQAGAQAGKKIREADPKAWIAQSMGSAEAKAKARQSCQSDAFRDACKKRELSKPLEERQRWAKQGQQTLVKNCGGEEAYRQMLSDRMKGRQRYINPETGKMRITYECPEGFVLKPTKGKDNEWR